VIIRVALGESAAGELIQRLLRQVDGDGISYDREEQQVCIDVRTNPDRTVVHVLNAVESWLAEAALPSTRIEIDDRSYLLTPPMPVRAQ